MEVRQVNRKKKRKVKRRYFRGFYERLKVFFVLQEF